NEHDRGTLASELAEELCPGVVQTLARPERVQLLARVEAERQAEVATVTEPLGDDGRRIILQDAEVLAQDLGERPVRGAVPVREAAAGALHRLPLLRGEPRPQLSHEPRLADAGVAHDRHQAGRVVANDPLVGRAKLVELMLSTDERLA